MKIPQKNFFQIGNIFIVFCCKEIFMWFFDWFSQIYFSSTLVFVIDFVAIGAFFIAFIAAFFLKDKSLFLSFSALISGVAYAFIIGAEEGETATSLGVATLLSGFGASYTITLIAFNIRSKILKRRIQREEMLRKLKFTLPDRDNSYVKARLNTVLQPENKLETEPEGEKKTFRLEHARQLLAKIKEAPLTRAERLEMEELSKLFNAYLKKYKWTSEDVRLINEMFAYLLKLSAKYSV